MSRRIDIELTSAQGDGTWTWRAAGAKQPRGVLDGTILPSDAKAGDQFKVEIEQELEGYTVTQLVTGRAKVDRDLLELLPVEREFQPVIETRARGDRPRRPSDDRRPRRERGDRDRGDRDRGDRDRGERGDRARGDRSPDDRPRTDPGDRGRGEPGDRRPRRERSGERRDGHRRPSFTPPPEIPQRPKPKRLRPGKLHRAAVLSELPEEQRPIAELAMQGIAAVRQRLREENAKAEAEGRAPMPEASVLKIAEELVPRLRVAEWRDRAEAARDQAAELDLRDLRSVVAASGDPIVARDESTRALADELKVVLAGKQEQELQFWYGDIDAALAVGRVVRALRLSSQPPKAGVPFPSDIAQRLADSANASLAPMDSPERWVAMLEAAAFSPVRTLIKPARAPDVSNDELQATVKRLAPALPGVAAAFGIEVDPGAAMPKPLRTPSRPTKGKPESRSRASEAAPQRRRGATDDPPAEVAAPDTVEETAPDTVEETAPDIVEVAAPDTVEVAAPDIDEVVAADIDEAVAPDIVPDIVADTTETAIAMPEGAPVEAPAVEPAAEALAEAGADGATAGESPDDQS